MNSETILGAINALEGERKKESSEDLNFGKALFAKVLFGFTAIKIVVLLLLTWIAFNINGYLVKFPKDNIVTDPLLGDKLWNMDGLLVIGQIVGLLLTVLFFIWMYSAIEYRNKINPDTVRLSPKWACFGFLIPIVNFVFPVYAMTDLWTGSAKIKEEKRKGHMMYGAAIATIWWMMFMVEKGFFVMNSSMKASGLIDSFSLSVLVGRVGIAGMIGVIHAVCLLVLIARVEYEQNDVQV